MRPLLLVRWRDAVTGGSGWRKRKKVRKQRCPIVKSVGWELERTDHELTLVSSMVDNEVDGDVTIPLGWIVEERRLN